MPYSDEQLKDIGAKFSTQRMIEQGRVSVANAREQAAGLGKKFPQPKVDELEDLIGQIQEEFGNQVEAKTAFSTGNVPVEEWITKAKAWISDVIAAADNAFEEDPDLQDEFHKGPKLRRSVPKITGWMQTLLALAEKHQDELAEWGCDDEEIREGRDLLKGLMGADAEQEQAVKDMPKATRTLNILKGRVFLLLKRLARSGRSAFQGDKATQDKFNLDILYRTGGGS